MVDAIRRQEMRVTDLPNHFGENYLFRTWDRVLLRTTVALALEKLAAHISFGGKAYRITPHQ